MTRIAHLFCAEVGLVVLDMVLLLEVIVENNWRILSMLRLMRILKFRGVAWRHLIEACKRGSRMRALRLQVMISLENRLAAKGNMKFVLYLTIFQCIAQVLAVNHVLACLLFYVGKESRELGFPSWIDVYQVDSDLMYFQYM